MATRGMIGYWDADTNTVIATYVHYDAYPEGVGAILVEHYNEPFAAAAVANAGYLSGLEPDLDKSLKTSVTKVFPTLYASVEEYLAEAWYDSGAEFIYLWDGYAWFVAPRDGDRRFTDVETFLQDE